MKNESYKGKLKALDCPIEKTVTLLGSYWSLIIINTFILKNKPLKFNELLRMLKPISSKTLSKKLKELVEYEILEKNVKSTTPVSTEYSITEKGKDFRTALCHMRDWSNKWHP